MLVSFLFIFFITWWLVFQACLPFGVSVPEEQEKGHAGSAPRNPNLGKKALAATIIAALIAYGIIWMMESGIIKLGAL